MSSCNVAFTYYIPVIVLMLERMTLLPHRTCTVARYNKIRWQCGGYWYWCSDVALPYPLSRRRTLRLETLLLNDSSQNYGFVFLSVRQVLRGRSTKPDKSKHTEYIVPESKEKGSN
jgi:hypothetical protein